MPMHLLSRVFLFLLSLISLSALPAKGWGQHVFYGKAHFLLEGTSVPEQEKEGFYDRLPVALKGEVRAPVWELSKNSAGLSIRFLTNSSSIKVKWKLLLNKTMNHMAETGIKGLDLYVRLPSNEWQYINTARPAGIENEFVFVEHMTKELREYRIYLPLYDGLERIEVGIDSGAVMKKGAPLESKPIIFYGTSITQGGCASRPGMAYPSIVGRKTGYECINLGFSANGRMEKPIAELISGTDALLYVIDCTPNMSVDDIRNNMIPLVETIRKKKKTTPVLFVENQLYDKSFLDTSLKKELEEKNRVLKQVFNALVKQKAGAVYYLEAEAAIGTDHEGTVDGVHFTDLGFMRFADFMIGNFRRLGLLQ